MAEIQKRSTIPVVRLPRTGTMIDPDIHRLRNGIPLYLFPSQNTEVIRLELTFEAGMVFENKALQARFANLMLPGGTSAMTASKIDEAFDYYGSFPNFGVDRDKAVVQIYMLPSNFNETARLINNIVYDPVFPESELVMNRENRLQSFLVNRQRVAFISADHLFETLFGSVHPYGKRLQPENFEELTREDIVLFHSQFYRKGIKRVVLSGFVNDSIVATIEELFGHRDASGENMKPLPLPENAECNQKVFIERPGAVQSSIRIARKTVPMSHPDYTGLKIVDTILGGYFGSRLMGNLREDKGYTYGAGSSLNSFRLAGMSLISTEVGAEHTSLALKEVYHEMDLLADKNITLAELKLVRRNMLGELVRQFDGPFAQTESFTIALDAGLTMNYYKLLEEKVKTITPSEIKQLAGTYYRKEDFCEIVAGKMQ
ncbi:MAG: insulinase family protein [Bacteroidales bacterium]|nr:insulinase family protein [Bacteroidales bacterium]